MIITENVILNEYSLTKNLFRKIRMVFDIENWLRKSIFATFWQLFFELLSWIKYFNVILCLRHDRKKGFQVFWAFNWVVWAFWELENNSVKFLLKLKLKTWHLKPTLYIPVIDLQINMHHLPENNTSQVQGSVIQPVGISGHETSTHSSTGNITTTSSIGKAKTFPENWVSKQSFFVLILTMAKKKFSGIKLFCFSR